MDRDLVARAQKGDDEAFAAICVSAADRLMQSRTGRLRDVTLAEDATQQALLNMWRDLPRLRDPALFEAWSYRLLVRACYARGQEGPQMDTRASPRLG